MTIKKNQILENFLPGASNPSAPVVRVIEASLERIGHPDMARVTSAYETKDDAWLIANNRTWAAPHANLRPVQDVDPWSHSSGLVLLGGRQ